MPESHFGALPEAKFEGSTRAGKFLDVEIIGTIYIGGDASIEGDITATGGAITGDMTITGELTVQDYITLGTGGFFRSAATGQRIEMTNTDKNVVSFFSGDVAEQLGYEGKIIESTNGAGVTRTIQFGMKTPLIDAADRLASFVVRSASPDGTSSAPGFVFAEPSAPGAGTGMAPEFRIQNAIPLITDGDVTLSAGDLTLTAGDATLTAGDITLTSGVFGSTALGSAAAPVFGIGSNFDDGFYSPADSQLGFVTAGTQSFYIDSSQNLILNTKAIAGVNWIRLEDGSAAAPSIDFTDDPGNGLYRVGADQLGISTGGAARVSINAARVDVDSTFLQLPVKATTGDPASPANGDTYVNTFDNKIRVYADGAWRDLATW